jgi:hypothetical protein
VPEQLVASPRRTAAADFDTSARKKFDEPPELARVPLHERRRVGLVAGQTAHVAGEDGARRSDRLEREEQERGVQFRGDLAGRLARAHVIEVGRVDAAAVLAVVERGAQQQPVSPLTIDEGVALLLQQPEAIARNWGFSAAGSRRGDQRVPAFWISEGRPKLGWCWERNPHTWLGTASCARREPMTG